MAKGLDKVAAREVYARMTADGSSVEAIKDVLKTVYPQTTPEDLIVFLAECIKNPPSPKNNQRNDRPQWSSDYEGSPSGCSSSSESRSC
jgi:hypothetical protein